ncbi:DegT/DnrJ/EryC1/StrS family aminotransferase [Thiocapsa marina]|uniref:GDP-perosamine synthase n=1 Tax=Thiocapsa marina 5811 TaxID=768671 RepID=F9U6Z5_9GAMM|nr:DegT/DnrJ/EryC1/StrS aminotransferase family protein [Thiocapsa marina]EGV20021.1 Glutamine--scyllo-inositol transaminase [Thiocapsa marina 5811]
MAYACGVLDMPRINYGRTRSLAPTCTEAALPLIVPHPVSLGSGWVPEQHIFSNGTPLPQHHGAIKTSTRFDYSSSHRANRQKGRVHKHFQPKQQPMIPVYKPFLTGREKEYVNRCLDSTWISSKGDYIERFESGFIDYVGIAAATTVCNGTVALHLALEALGIGQGDEVIVPSLTYIASVNTILQTQAKPVFADSRADSWQVDPDDIRRKITPRTRAVMVVHLYGLPCDMESIVELCREHGLLLIEDCAEAFGTLYRDQHVGTFGDVATFSFYGNKTITTGEGGMVVSTDPRVIEKAIHLKTQGVSRSREYWHDTLAYNYRMTNICAAIGVAQLEAAETILARKREIAACYRERLRGLPLSFHDTLPGTRHSFWMCSIALNDPLARDPLRAHLRNAGIDTRPVFHPAHTMPHHATGESLPVAESISARGINLPSYPDLSESEVETICATISRALS